LPRVSYDQLVAIASSGLASVEQASARALFLKASQAEPTVEQTPTTSKLFPELSDDVLHEKDGVRGNILTHAYAEFPLCHPQTYYRSVHILLR